MIYIRNRETMWKRIKMAHIVAVLLHFPFFIFASSFSFSSSSVFTAYFFFFYDAIFWVLCIPLCLNMAGKSGKPFIFTLIAGIVAFIAVIHNGIGAMIAKGKCTRQSKGGLYCDVGGFFLFIVMLFALSQSSVYIATLFIGRMDQYNPRYNFENNANQNLQPAISRPVQNNQPSQHGYAPSYNAQPIVPPKVNPQPNPWETQPENSAYQPLTGESYFPDDLPYDPRFSDKSEKKDSKYSA